MNVLGLVTEYNPFHNGHKYHIEEAIKASKSNYVVCVMSGNFVQRGAPALLDKWSRTKMALANGVDLMIELPVAYALQSAEYFAFGAIKILDSLNVVDNLCFGSEIGQIKILKDIAKTLVDEPSQFSLNIKSFLNEGQNFAKSRENALVKHMDGQYDKQIIQQIISSPNNILGIEYLKALYKLNSKINPITIQRYKSHYHSLETNNNIVSATAIRNIIENQENINEIKNYIPSNCFDILSDEIKKGKSPMFSQQFELAILTLVRNFNIEELLQFPDVGEGLENRIQNSSHEFGTLNEVISSIKTKRYTYTRLQRIMFNILIGITKEMLDEFQSHGGPQYIRILGMNNKGKELLKVINDTATLPIIVKPSSFKYIDNDVLQKMIQLDFLATDLYSLHFPEKDKRKGKLDFYTSPIII